MSGNDDVEDRSRDADAPEFCRYDAQKSPDLILVRRRRRWFPVAISIKPGKKIKQEGGTPTDA
jgi:hypothetical protein